MSFQAYATCGAVGLAELVKAATGVMVTGRFGDETMLFRLAGQLEQARPWFHRMPPIFG